VPQNNSDSFEYLRLKYALSGKITIALREDAVGGDSRISVVVF